jgi:hypothetical protein
MDAQAQHPARKTDRESHAQRATSFGSPIEGFRRTAGPLAQSGARVGIYKGHDAETGTHYFSAESTGGGETDSHVVTGDFSHLEKGERYAFNNDGSPPRRYSDNDHHDLPGAPITEMNKNMPVPGERPRTGPVRRGSDFSGGMVGHVLGSDAGEMQTGRRVTMSAESTGGGGTDAHTFDFPHDRNLPRTLAGKRVVMMPSKDGSFHTIENYNHRAHGHLPGAPLEEE